MVLFGGGIGLGSSGYSCFPSDTEDRLTGGSFHIAPLLPLPTTSRTPPSHRRFSFGGFSSPPPSHPPHPDYRDSERARKGSRPWKSGALFEVGIKLKAAKSWEERDLLERRGGIQAFLANAQKVSWTQVNPEPELRDGRQIFIGWRNPTRPIIN